VLEQNGIDPVVQEFHFSKPKILPRTIFPIVSLIWIVLSLVNVRFLGNNLVISLIVLSLPLVLIFLIPDLNSSNPRNPGHPCK